jgi:transcriptional regulator with AAA-type ATPase domain
MSSSIKKYKVFRSFRLKVLPEDRLSLSFTGNERPHPKNLQVLDINFTGISFLTTDELPENVELNFKIVRKRIITKKEVELKGRVVRSYFNDDYQMPAYAIEFSTSSLKSIESYLEDFILEFNTKRLKAYLLDSSVEEKSFSGHDANEMLSIFYGLYGQLDQQDMKEKIDLIRASFHCEGAILYGANHRTKMLEPILSTSGELSAEVLNKKFSFRSGTPGMSFSTGEVVYFKTSQDTTETSVVVADATVKSSLSIPVTSKNNERIGVLQLLNSKAQTQYKISDEHLIKMLASSFEQQCANYQQKHSGEVFENSNSFDASKLGIVGDSPFSEGLKKFFRKFKDVQNPLLITGEKGSGKLKFAYLLHSEGRYNNHEVSYFNILDFEKTQDFFEQLKSLLEKDSVGTLLLENTLELSKDDQELLYHTICSSQYRILFIETHLPVRLTEKWNIGLQTLIGTHHIHFPPLRLRKSDILAYANFYIKQYCDQHKLDLKILANSAAKQFLEYTWPGNLSELKDVIFSACAEQQDDQILNIEVDPIERKKMQESLAFYLAKIADQSLPLEKQTRILKMALQRVPATKKVS